MRTTNLQIPHGGLSLGRKVGETLVVEHAKTGDRLFISLVEVREGRKARLVFRDIPDRAFSITRAELLEIKDGKRGGAHEGAHAAAS